MEIMKMVYSVYIKYHPLALFSAMFSAMLLYYLTLAEPYGSYLYSSPFQVRVKGSLRIVLVGLSVRGVWRGSLSDQKIVGADSKKPMYIVYVFASFIE